ncbi:MAG: hypothetical protein IPN29_09340 [Saprospiraceae bacterium]|nr:hypothetical protein [Saprospiraceae bacterium]
MQEEIVNNLGDAQRLESLYQEQKSLFRQAFNLAYENIKQDAVARVWHARLNPVKSGQNGEIRKEWLLVALAIVVAGFIAKIPGFTGQEPDLFYQRNVGFIVFPIIASYFCWKNGLSMVKWLMVMTVFIIAAVYINLLPKSTNSDTLILASIHLPMLLWSVVGISFIGAKFDNMSLRFDFLRFNGDLAVMMAILLMAGVVMTSITFGLFNLIEIDLAYAFENYLAVWGIPAIPILAVYLVLTNPQLVNKISPVIARIFTPMVLVILVSYLTAVIITGKDPYNNREFLLIFNVLLIAVMAIILFSTSELVKNPGSKIEKIMLTALSVVTIAINGIALSAILFRISEWGLTPNRFAVLGSNILILVHLLLVTYRLIRSLNGKEEIEKVERTIAAYVPVYMIWAAMVVFLFPLMFGFK